MARKAKKKVVKKKGKTVEAYDPKNPLPDPKQELFCELYTNNTTYKFFGNGKHSYAFAYGKQERLDELHESMAVASHNTGRGKKKKISPYSLAEREVKQIENVCAASATRLLINVNVKARCNFLMDALFTDEIMDRELVYTIQQRHDLQSKVRAWEMAAKLKQRIKDKLEVKHDFDPIKGFTFVRAGEVTSNKKGK